MQFSAEMIHDIKGPIPPDSPQFFVLLAAVISAAAAVCYFRRRKLPLATATTASPRDPGGAGQISTLSTLYRKGEIDTAALFDRLWELLRTSLAADSSPALTGFEMINGANNLFPGDLFLSAKAIVELAEKVRFGKHLPEKQVVLDALDRAMVVVTKLQESRR